MAVDWTSLVGSLLSLSVDVSVTYCTNLDDLPNGRHLRRSLKDHTVSNLATVCLRHQPLSGAKFKTMLLFHSFEE